MDDSEKRFSLDLELDTQRQAVGGVMALLDAAQLNPNIAVRDLAPVAAIAGLIAARMELVRATLKGQLDPKWVMEPYNTVSGGPTTLGDIRLRRGSGQ